MQVVARFAPAALLVLLLVGGCGELKSCTLIAEPDGVSVGISPLSSGATPTTAEVTLCGRNGCTTGTGRPFDPPPSGGQAVFVEFDMTSEAKRVTVRLFDRRGDVLFDRSVGVLPTVTYPNGKDCGSGSHIARVTATTEGSLVAA